MIFELPVLKYYLVDYFPLLPVADLGRFRGAINKLLNNSEVLAHNHTSTGMRYAYPLVQYGTDGVFTQIRAIGEGLRLFEQMPDWRHFQVKLSERSVQFQMVRVREQQFSLQPVLDFKTYYLQSWLPLNQQNVTRFRALSSPDEKVRLLQQILTGNILSMAKGCGMQVKGHLEVFVEEIYQQQTVKYKQVPFESFSLKFKTNMLLPDQLGLGKGVSNGFGTIRIL